MSSLATSLYHDIARAGFKQPDAYERSRPVYPSESVEMIFKLMQVSSENNFDKIKCLDLGAGTGKFTRLLLPFFSESSQESAPIVAIEPSEEMVNQFRAVIPDWVPVHVGTATNIEFPDHTFDVVIAAQAFHWFANIESLREIHRVLKPNGTLVLTWNLEDDRMEWVRKLRDTFEAYDTNVPQYHKMLWKSVFHLDEATKLFGELNYTTFDWEEASHTTLLLERILSISYVTRLDEPSRQTLRQNLLSLLVDTFGKTADDPTFEFTLPFVNHFYWCNKLTL